VPQLLELFSKVSGSDEAVDKMLLPDALTRGPHSGARVRASSGFPQEQPWPGGNSLPSGLL
jgi:hypothetical protein